MKWRRKKTAKHIHADTTAKKTYDNDLHFNNRLRFACWRQCVAEPTARKSSSQLFAHWTTMSKNKNHFLFFRIVHTQHNSICVVFHCYFIPNGNCDSDFGLTFVGINERNGILQFFFFGIQVQFPFNWSIICNCICIEILNTLFAIIQRDRDEHDDIWMFDDFHFSLINFVFRIEKRALINTINSQK